MNTETIRVRICDKEHPHYPAVGVLTGKVIRLFGKPMAELKFDQDSHGTEACFVDKGQVEKA
jgi:hypothetical protein